MHISSFHGHLLNNNKIQTISFNMKSLNFIHTYLKKKKNIWDIYQVYGSAWIGCFFYKFLMKYRTPNYTIKKSPFAAMSILFLDFIKKLLNWYSTKYTKTKSSCFPLLIIFHHNHPWGSPSYIFRSETLFKCSRASLENGCCTENSIRIIIL